ncbi:family 31 putative glycoside hydrolase [Podospora fimiseda]|uniref:alpha-glucosidase n=1 Tax=Podospora fimiseda TaxID=252190 RepID=A0AAN7BIV8_9PEZI|nr:family 31 putative glycoside hydrolase [Podospora fimiseda]
MYGCNLMLHDVWVAVPISKQPQPQPSPPPAPAPAPATPPNRYSFPSDPTTNPKAIITGPAEGGHYRFSILTTRLIRFEWSEDGGFEDRASTFALFRNFNSPTFAVVDKEDRLVIITEYLRLCYDKKRFSYNGLSIKVGNDIWQYDGKSYGDLGGTARTLDGAWGRVDLEPGVLSRKPYAVLDDSESMLFEDGWIATRKPGRIDGYMFAYNRDHKAAIKDFYRLSGSQPVLPRWALGNWWSRYHEYSAAEYMDLVDRFQSEGVPLNVAVIDMDWHKVKIPPQYGSGWTGYSWNRDLFPKPEAFIQELHARGLKVTVNDHPADGIRAFEDQYKEVSKALNHDTSKEKPIPFDCTSRKFLDAYFDVLKVNLEKQGIDFWWIDWQQGTKSKLPGVDPLWVLNHYHYLTSQRNVKTIERPITFSRYAGAGSHRYPIGFSGDTQITWAGLEFQPEFTATASNIGYGWWSHDIGGHFGGIRSNQLTARWVQLGCFSPILRLHSSKSPWNSKEPWNFEDEASKVMKEYLVLRHRLIPYLYTMNIRASYENEPLIQPMYWNHREEEAYTVPNQYYFGSELIVAPITSPNSPVTFMGSTRAWIPHGRYVSLFKPHITYDGGRYVRLHRTLDKVPVLAREGSIIVLDGTKEGKQSQDPLHAKRDYTICLVVGVDATFELVEESQESLESGNRPPLSSYNRIPITWKQREGLLTIGPETKPSSRPPAFTVKLIGVTISPEYARASRSPQWKYDVDINGYASLASPSASLGPCGKYHLGEDLQLDIVNIRKHVFDTVYRAEIWYDTKEILMDIVTSQKDPVDQRVKFLNIQHVDPELKNAIMEIWAADSRAEGSAFGHEIWAVVKDLVDRRDPKAPIDTSVEPGEDWDDYVIV